MPVSPPPREFFVDRGLGRYVVPDALRAVGQIVHTMGDVFGGREQQVDDEEWLALAGQQGWIVLTKDRRIRRRPAEMRAIIEHDVSAFVLASGSLGGSAQAARFIASLDRIITAASMPGPCIYEVRARSIKRLLPDVEQVDE